MTTAQREALEILAAHPGERIGGWKWRSRAEPIPRINYLAGANLVRAGLARRQIPLYHSPYTFDDVFIVTNAGIVAAAEARR